MISEGSFAEVKPTEQGPDPEVLSEHEITEALDRFLETHRSIDNAGKNAVILKLFSNELSPEIRKVMAAEESEDNPEGSVSIKALKIYNPGDAEKEYKALVEARNVVQKSEDADSFARVPRAYGHYEIPISGTLKDFLNKSGASLTGEKAGLIVMDYIEGEDLAAVLHREYLKRFSSENDPYPSDDVTAPSFERLFQSLERSDFVLPREIVAQIERTIEALHANRLYHNDLHARNIILRKADLENPQAFIIDFATATHGQPADGEEALSDRNIVNRLIPLVKTNEEKLHEERMRHEDEWKRRLAIIEDNPKSHQRYLEVKQCFTDGDDRRLESQFIGSSTFDQDFKTFMGALLKIYREDPGERERIARLLDGQESNRANRPFIIRKIREWKEVVGI